MESLNQRDIDEAVAKMSMEMDLTETPMSMTRKERRQWYHNNRKKLNLPRWGDLRKLK